MNGGEFFDLLDRTWIRAVFGPQLVPSADKSGSCFIRRTAMVSSIHLLGLVFRFATEPGGKWCRLFASTRRLAAGLLITKLPWFVTQPRIGLVGRRERTTAL
jgi:hypothetical protein